MYFVKCVNIYTHDISTARIFFPRSTHTEMELWVDETALILGEVRLLRRKKRGSTMVRWCVKQLSNVKVSLMLPSSCNHSLVCFVRPPLCVIWCRQKQQPIAMGQ